MDDHARSLGRDSPQSPPFAPSSSPSLEHLSDSESCATAVSETVMAEQATNDVVKEAQSMGPPAPIGDTASATSTPAVNGAPEPSKPLPAPSAAPHANGADATLNGDTGDQSATESQAVADASGGSDTDISRPGSVDQSRQDAGHVRTSSALKKPSTFKSVSVTKTFLAKSAVSAPALRLGEKAAPAVQPANSTALTAKPRLVAKSGAGNAPRSLSKANGAGTGPDASKVWNKNQPVPPPPPKQFTDEELKQQYGIHLATRLQADEAGKEAKWADIDDDEDDWAPEAVQWMDGTKSSVTAVETQPPPAEEPKTILKPDPPADVSQPASTTDPSTSKPSVTGGVKTILKPGSHTQPAPTKSSLVLKGQPEKPTLVAKPSTTEKKSPWATLPPVEKVPPVQINPPVQQQQQPPQRFSQRDPYGYDSAPPPTKDIAPDDFNRSWREDRGSRELFNSQSGRFEPVNDMRRNSVRDSNFRQQPSVLQRPSQDGPAEPSAAFQTSRSSMDMPAWGRRRTSSNVSSDQARRMSIDRRAPDMPRGLMNMERRESQSVSGPDSSDPAAPRPLTLVQPTSPNTSHAHPASPYGSVASSGPHDAPPPNPAPPVENPVEVQKRLMADKIERARLKKQQEQEAEKKAEAERKERIAKRLAAMGPLPESKSKAKDPSPSRTAEQSQKSKITPVPSQSPPKPPVPTVDGEVAQYGMIKVHHAQPLKKSSQAEPSPAAKSALSSSGPPPTKAQTEDQAKASSSLNQQSANTFDTFTRDKDNSRQSTEQAKSQTNQSEGLASSGQKPLGSQTAWSPATAPQTRGWTSQVWGPPPTKERALGNGTFDSGYNRGQPRSSSQQQLPAQTASSTSPAALNLAPQASATPQGTVQLPPSQPMYPQTAPMPVQAAAPVKPGRTAPPLANGWGNFEAHIRQDDAGMAAKARQDRERLGEAFRPEIRETYKDQRGQAQTTLHDKVPGNLAVPDATAKKDDMSNAVKPVHELSSPQQNLNHGAPLQQTTGPRASRFFPRPVEAPSTAASATSGKMDSPPPPPETEAHPAFTGDISQPLVRLPRPSPVVRLPPSASGNSTYVEPPVNMPARGQPLGARPLTMNPEWQARFNKLLEKPASAPAPGSSPRATSTTTTTSTASSKPGALAPAALSKSSLEVRGNANSATVSLPSGISSRIFSDDRGKDVITRYGAEALFEDREFGSLPIVKLSKVSHLAANEPAASSPQDDSHVRSKRFENPFTIRRLEAFDVEKLAQKIDVIIFIPNMRDAIIKSMPRRRRGGPKTNGISKPKQNSGQTLTSAGGSKDRPRKLSQQGQNDRSATSTRPSAHNAWNSNNRSTPPHQQSTWARRAAASVH